MKDVVMSKTLLTKTHTGETSTSWLHLEDELLEVLSEQAFPHVTPTLCRLCSDFYEDLNLNSEEARQLAVELTAIRPLLKTQREWAAALEAVATEAWAQETQLVFSAD